MRRYHKRFNLILLTLIFIDILLATVWMQVKFGQSLNNPTTSSKADNHPEIAQLTGKNLSFGELKKYFTDLANQKGAQYAYEVLKIAPVPPNTDMHLLGHVVGDVLYKQQGLNGIKICTQDFRNACSHSIVVGLLLDKGEGMLPQIAEACKQAPGGSGAYTMCYHGLGHGVLAYTDYDLPKAVELCQKVGTKEHNNQESNQCDSGAVMEIISGGDHDKKLWAKKRPLYLQTDNPVQPCFSDYLPKEARTLCLIYITPYLMEAAGANLGHPTEADFAKSFKYCEAISETNSRNTCFGGFGKEFTGLAQNRDIRKIDQMTDAQFLKVYNWCKLAENPQGITACLGQALSSIYWGGENDRSASIRFCNVVADTDNHQICFHSLIGQVSSYIKDTNYRQSFCSEIPDDFLSECKKKLL